MESKDVMYYLLIVAVLIGLISLFFWVRGESVSCLSQPFVYGAEKFDNAECYCSNDEGSFMFNKTYFGNRPEQDVQNYFIMPK